MKSPAAINLSRFVLALSFLTLIGACPSSAETITFTSNGIVGRDMVLSARYHAFIGEHWYSDGVIRPKPLNIYAIPIPLIGDKLELYLGLENAKWVLVSPVGGKDVVVGDASDLDQIVPIAPITITVHRGIFQREYTVTLNLNGASPREYRGKRVDIAALVERATANILSGGALDDERNVRSLQEIAFDYPKSLYMEKKDQNWQARLAGFEAMYADPMKACLARLNPEQQKRLWHYNQHVYSGAKSYLAGLSGFLSRPSAANKALFEGMMKLCTEL